MGELLDALDFAHEAGVIHRDVKPANVMLDAQRRVKLADFGVARIQDSERSAAGTMVGTPAFMSPEQIQGAKIDRRTDIFSAGIILYQLLTGEQPFTGAGAWTVAKKIMQDDPPRPSSVVKSVSPVFDAIVDKALAKKPAERYRERAGVRRRAARRGPAPATPSVPPAPPRRPSPGAPQASETEVEFWRAIQNSTDAAEFEFYLEQFPEGTYAPLARHKIAQLKEPRRPPTRKAAEEQWKPRRTRRSARGRGTGKRREAEEQAKREADGKGATRSAERARREARSARGARPRRRGAKRARGRSARPKRRRSTRRRRRRKRERGEKRRARLRRWRG